MSLSLLKAEIEQKKRKPTEDPTASAPPARKWVKRGEIEAQREQEYRKRQMEKEQLRKQNQPAEDLATPSDEAQKAQENEEPAVPQFVLPREQVIARLKERGHPITFFAETDLQRAERLRKLELAQPMEYIEGVGSDFVKIIRDEEEQEQTLEEALQKREDDDPTFKIENREPESTEEQLLFLFRKIWWEWHDDLERRSELEKKTAAGKIETATLRQTRIYLKPFFQLLVKRRVPPEILKEVKTIYDGVVTRNYLLSNDAYYRLAIGNSPWPMGVTMVGIHERSAREKIHSSSVAHVLNDETQRKYIQAVKRLITFMEKKYPRF